MAITVTINGKQYTFRNLEEQVLFLTQELEKVLQSLGNALPDPIPGPPGEPGATGGPGPEGPRGKGIYGCSSVLPSPTAYQEGDMYLLFNGELYKKVSGNWVMQTTLKGSQGAVGLPGGSEVIANPASAFTDYLSKLKIDGTTYAIPNGNYVKWINAPQGDALTDQEKEWIINGVFVNGDFLGYKNPVLFPASKSGNYYYGVIAGPYEGTSYTIIGQYQINPDNTIVEIGDYGNIALKCIKFFNGAEVPQFPSSPTHRKKIVYNSNNTLQWIDDKLFRHNIRLDFTGDIYVYFTLYSASGAPITDISEVLELKYQAIGSMCVYSNNVDNTAAIINNFNSGDLGIDIGGGVTHLDYGNDLVSIVDDNSEVY